MKHTTRTGFSHLQRRSVSGLIWPFQDNLNRAVFHHGSKDDLSVWRWGEETKKQGVVDASLWTQRTLYERIRSHSYRKCLLLADRLWPVDHRRELHHFFVWSGHTKGNKTGPTWRILVELIHLWIQKRAEYSSTFDGPVRTSTKWWLREVLCEFWSATQSC